MDNELVKIFKRFEAKLDRIEASLNTALEDMEHRVKTLEWKTEAIIEARD